MQLTHDIDRRAHLTQADFAREYLRPMRPVILTDALSQWRALGRWSPEFFRTQYGDLEVKVDGERMRCVSWWTASKSRMMTTLRRT